MLPGLTREQNASYREEPTDGRFGAFGLARKREAPSAWEVDAGKFVQKAAQQRGLEKRGEGDGYALYANYATGERLFVNKADGAFVYDHPGYGLPRQGSIKEFETDGPFVQKGADLKPKAGDKAIDSDSTDGGSGNDSFSEAHRRRK